MKTAISIPDELFAEADRLAKRLKQSRSEIYRRAVAEYLARHAPDEITEAMNKVVTEVAEPPDAFVAAASRGTLGRSEW